MKVKLRPVLWTKDEDKDGNCPIAISIAGGGGQTYYNTKIKCPAEMWDGKQIKKGFANYDINNNTIDTLIKTAEREILIRQSQGEVITLELVKTILNPEKGVTGGLLLPFATELIKDKKGSTKRRYTVELDKLKEYAGAGLRFGQITPQWLSDYYKYLTKTVTHNSAINAFKVIRHVFNEAKDQKLTSLYPFKDWKYPQYKAPKKEYLTLEECEKIYEILHKNVEDGVKLVAAFFLLEAYAGLRVSDWHKFKIEKMVDSQDLVFTTTKTGTPVRIPYDIMPSLKKVVDYIRENKLHYNESSEHANRVLKTIAPLAGINKRLTTHIARHSCASMWLNKGMTDTEIGIMLGITKRQVSTYAHAHSNILRNAVSRLGGL